ncbi:ATP-binding protein [Arthrospira platensis BEA 1257B]
MRHEEVRVAPCGDHEVVFVIRDISEQQAALRERQKAAATIRKSEDRFARIANNMPGVLYQYVLHPDGSHNFIYISERCQQIFGLDADTITRDANELFRLFESEDFISLKSSILLSASTLNTWSWEGKLITPFGEKKWIQGISQPEQQANGDILWDGVVVDISERKLMEIKLQKTVAELDRTTRLKDEFLANMSHELRTPLNGILGMSEALKQGILGTLNPNQHHAIAMIEKSGKHLLELISDILDLSKIEAGKLELYLTEVSVQELCNSSLTLVNHLAFTKQINIESNIPQQLQKTFIKVDNRRLRQVLINLLSNAVKFTHKAGKINLNVGIKPSPNPAISTPQSIYFSVIDNGIGIAPDDLDKLFLPFTQIDSSLNRQYSGTGLGLALVKQIIELHGGCVQVSSQLGKGSCFTVYLPYNETSNNMSNLPDSYRWELPSYLNVINPQSPLIMLAVEKEAHLITLSSYLEAKGYSLLIARNGQEAIALIESQSPQLVVIDIQIPVLEGLAAIKYIRQNLKLTNLPIIALTAVETTGEPEKLREAGANEYLTQPIKLKHLSNLIHNLLNP